MCLGENLKRRGERISPAKCSKMPKIVFLFFFFKSGGLGDNYRHLAHFLRPAATLYVLG